MSMKDDILVALKNGDSLSNEQLSARFGKPQASVRRSCQHLRAEGLIVQSSGEGERPVTWSLPKADEKDVA
jgi:DNA-binding IclR family transcriptional regulator